MGNYTIIADIGTFLIKLIRDNMVPDMIENANGILLCSPSEKGDASLGIYLYDVIESIEIRANGMQNIQINQQKYPSVYLTLYFMITAYSNSDIKFRAVEEQRILGRVIQIFADNNVIPMTAPEYGRNEINPRIELLSIGLEDKFKVWNSAGTPYKTSVFYKISPVELDSAKTKEIKRVTEIKFKIEE